MGGKANLILELDEHSAVAGVMTRLEAYRNVIDNTMQKTEPCRAPWMTTRCRFLNTL